MQNNNKINPNNIFSYNKNIKHNFDWLILKMHSNLCLILNYFIRLIMISTLFNYTRNHRNRKYIHQIEFIHVFKC